MLSLSPQNMVQAFQYQTAIDNLADSPMDTVHRIDEYCRWVIMLYPLVFRTQKVCMTSVPGGCFLHLIVHTIHGRPIVQKLSTSSYTPRHSVAYAYHPIDNPVPRIPRTHQIHPAPRLVECIAMLSVCGGMRRGLGTLLSRSTNPRTSGVHQDQGNTTGQTQGRL